MLSDTRIDMDRLTCVRICTSIRLFLLSVSVYVFACMCLRSASVCCYSVFYLFILNPFSQAPLCCVCPFLKTFIFLRLKPSLLQSFESYC